MPNAAVIVSADFEKQVGITDLLSVLKLYEIFQQFQIHQGYSANQCYPPVMIFNHPVTCYIDLLLCYTVF